MFPGPVEPRSWLISRDDQEPVEKFEVDSISTMASFSDSIRSMSLLMIRGQQAQDLFPSHFRRFSFDSRRGRIDS